MSKNVKKSKEESLEILREYLTTDQSKGATVDEYGFVTVAKDAEDGDVIITAETANGKKASIVLTIADGKIHVNTDQLRQETAE